ncbi:MAG: septum formation initiator [Phenylobacterium sp. RIFCSPHIGHO2_01_FULL_69_31]|uniref:S10 family peptidase n=1 Tax=Phenylobacterium sp. RIFCSPHIGHO2_01_FULL_69_31 TaxID=1801944 RepID=UPI0008CBE73D|nr:peptidase S10 [Phenylobacterium sp. RIFCSPHIGHO2_01_FULL_69_31]OHB31877.1 MAG: septum formation initiator [Phenylobacterium sp. RIFCSPHIGHO2_01_FULL_69_31]
MRLVALLAIAAVVASSAQAQAPAATTPPPNAGPFAIPMSRPTPPGPVEPLPAPKRFVTKRAITVKGVRVPYTAIAGETYLYNRAAEPIGSIFSFTYLKEGPTDPNRPVMFVFNGGPGSSSLWLHMGVVGPRRVVLDREVNPTNTPPFGVADNPHSLLDVVDLVFIDPVGTGWSRVVGKGTTADFWGVDEDADTVSQFIELWLTEHRRWNAPKFVMGESYGSVRAAVLPRALMGGPLYMGVMRGITLNGVVLLGTTLDARNATGAAGGAEMRQALALPALADTAWVHGKIDRQGRDIEAFHQEVVAFARDDYAEALRKAAAGTLPDDERAAILARLSAYTGLPASAFGSGLTISDAAFGRQILADRGLQVGAYDSRYTLPLAGSGGDPVGDDPAMGRYVPGFVSAFHQMVVGDLKVEMDRPYGAIVWKDLLPSWNWNRTGVPPGQSFATDLAVAMRRNEKLRVLVASGYYDLTTHAAPAEYAVEQAKMPADRMMLRRYASGHMLYLGDTAAAFADDVRTLIRDATR